MTPPFAVVAIPAHNEAERIGECLAALAMQRDPLGAPLAIGLFEVLVFANDCTDDTDSIVTALARQSPVPINLVAEALPSAQANAGGARRRALDLAAERLLAAGRTDGLLLTTDADSRVAPTWVAATLAAFAQGVDAVAGYVDAHPDEMLRLGRSFILRGRLEEAYMRAVAEIDALCDPRPHDPWPNHKVSAGASLAVTLAAYRAIGGLPIRVVGEDMALTRALEGAGFKVRHALDVVVSTSCRFEGRVAHGAGETMRQRHADLDAACDGELEPARRTLRRSLARGRLRRRAERGALADPCWAARFGLTDADALAAVGAWRTGGFESLWSAVSGHAPYLGLGQALRPSDLPHEIRRAETCLRRLRAAILKPR